MAVKRKKPKFGKLSINSERRGQLMFDTAYNAPDAARIATKRAKQGWKVQVQNWASLGTSRNIQMRCEPATKRDKTVARCTLSSAFKKQIRGR